MTDAALVSPDAAQRVDKRRPTWDVFSPGTHKNVTLSEAPHRVIGGRRLDCAESKDPDDAYLAMLPRAFQPPNPENRVLLRYALDGQCSSL
jgi:hypothetical protein